jgi:hypothetical protein
MAPLLPDDDNRRSSADVDPVMGAWYRRARESQFAHYDASARYSALARRLGVPTVLLSAAAGTTLFATLQEHSAPPRLRLVVGLVSLLAAILAALQTFLGFAERADKHRAAASAYGAIRRAIEQYQALPPTSRAGAESAMETVRKRLDETSQSAPDVPNRIWVRAQAAINHTSRPEGFRRRSVERAQDQESQPL